MPGEIEMKPQTMTTVKIGTAVRMNKAFLATLRPEDRRRESRRRYTVTNLHTMGDTVIVDMIDGRNRKTGTSTGWLEIVEAR